MLPTNKGAIAHAALACQTDRGAPVISDPAANPAAAPALLTYQQMFRVLGVGNTKGWRIIREAKQTGSLEIVLLGGREMVTADSLRAYISALPRVRAE